MKCRDATYKMHDYLDDDIDEYSHQELFNHIKACPDCKEHFEGLKRTELILTHLPKKRLDSNFTQSVLNHIPHNKKELRFINWLKRNSVIVAASIFLFLFTISSLPYLFQDTELKIVTNDNQQLIINGNDVIVPEGKTIVGDITIENGNLEIKGEVQGNVTVINGEILMASASKVDGHTKEIDQFAEWIWYYLKNLWNKIQE